MAVLTVVFVADPSLGNNILNFNVGSNIDILVPSNFWSRLAGVPSTQNLRLTRGAARLDIREQVLLTRILMQAFAQ